jgi:hypothetical protein
VAKRDEISATSHFCNLVIIKAIINNYECLCLLDTGSSCTVIHPRLVPKEMLRSTQIQLNTVFATGVCKYTADLTIRFPKVPLQLIFPFLVFEVKRPILGNDLLKRLNAQINFHRKSVIIQGQEIPFFLHSEELNVIENRKESKVQLQQRVILPSQQWSLVQVEIKIPDVSFEPSEKLMTYHNIIIPPLYFISSGKVTIPILNPNSFPIQLNFNTSLGDVHGDSFMEIRTC